MTLDVISGGWDGEYLADILQFDASSGEWRLVGQMTETREWHAVSVVTEQSLIEFCQQK